MLCATVDTSRAAVRRCEQIRCLRVCELLYFVYLLLLKLLLACRLRTPVMSISILYILYIATCMSNAFAAFVRL